jgi:phage tail-like protein
MAININRFDPYKTYRFLLKWEGRPVAAASKVSPLKRAAEVVKHREGGDPSTSRKSPGRTTFEAITLERGVTQDDAFGQWANGASGGTSLDDFRRDIVLEIYDEAGELALTYRLLRCWVSEYEAISDLDAPESCVAFQRIRLENEGWEPLTA